MGGWGEVDDGWGFAGAGEEAEAVAEPEPAGGSTAEDFPEPAAPRVEASAEDFPAPPAAEAAEPVAPGVDPPPAEGRVNPKAKGGPRKKSRRNSKEAKAQGKKSPAKGKKFPAQGEKPPAEERGGAEGRGGRQWEEELVGLRASVEALKAENAGLSEGLEAAGERVRASQSAYDAARAEKAALEAELTALRAEKQVTDTPPDGRAEGPPLLFAAGGGDTLKKKLVALEHFAREVGDAESKHAESMSEVRKVALEAVATAEGAAKELQQARDRLAEKDAALGELRASIEEMEGSSSKLKSENSALKKDLRKSLKKGKNSEGGGEKSPGQGAPESTSKAAQELETLKEEVEGLKSELEGEREARFRLEEAVKRKDLEISAIHDGASAASSLAADSQEKVAAVKRELTASTSALDAAVAARNDAESQAKALTEKLREMEKSESLSLEGAAKQGVELKDLAQRCEALEASLAAKEKEAEEKTAQAVQDAVARQELEAEALTLEACEVLQSKFQEREEHHLKEAEDLRQSLDDSEQELEAAQARVKELEELEASMSRLKTLQEEKEMTLQQVLDERDDLQTEIKKEKDASQERTKRFVVVQAGFKETETGLHLRIEGLERELKQAKSRIEQEESGKADSLEAAEGRLRDATERLQEEEKAKDQAESEAREAMKKVRALEGELQVQLKKMAETEKHLEVSNARVETLQAQAKSEAEKESSPGALAEVAALRERQKDDEEAARVLRMRLEELEGRTMAAEAAKIQVSLNLAEADDLLVKHGLLRESSGGDAGAPGASGAGPSSSPGSSPPTEPSAEEYLRLRRELQVAEQRNRELAWQVKMFSEPKAQAAASGSLWSLILGANPVSAASCAPTPARPGP